MRSKQNRKRRANGAVAGDDGDDDPDVPCVPARETWSGWVEMESEPAFFNVMLREMGVHGVKIQEVYSLDDEMLAALPQPVNALIFLFRYHSEDQATQEAPPESDGIWFANQLPEFACATVALLNIVNNIPDLVMGPEMRQFKDFTKGMPPIRRGDAIDSFDFIRRIHNSFARENDLLSADMHIKGKVDKAKKQQSIAKARATKEAKKHAQVAAQGQSSVAEVTVRSSARHVRPSPGSSSSNSSTPFKEPPSQPTLSMLEAKDTTDDDDYQTKAKPEEVNAEATLRRSTRTPKPRRGLNALEDEKDESEEQGFHFVAYMPIEDRVWKLDGLDHYPHDLGGYNSGSFAEGTEENGVVGSWIRVAAPAIQARMAQFEGTDIQFNLMAVVHDPLTKEREELAKNIKSLQIVGSKLASIAEDWYEMEGAETTKEVILDINAEFGITQPDIDGVELEDSTRDSIAAEEDLLKLIEIRQGIISQQQGLRVAVRDIMMGSNEDDEKAKHRRHDYRGFVRGWLGALAEIGMLEELLEE